MERSQAFNATLFIVLICLIGLLCFMIISKPPVTQGWEVQGNDRVYYLLTGSDDTLYAFHGDNVTAIESNGSIAWNYQVPDGWKVIAPPDMSSIYSGYLWSYNDHPVVSESSGTIYLCLYSPESISHMSTGNSSSDNRVLSKVVAISPQGYATWEYQLYTYTMPWSDYGSPGSMAIQAYGDRIYIFHDYEEEILSASGKPLSRIGNASEPGAIDEAGNVYIVRAVKPDVTANGSTQQPDDNALTALRNDDRFYGENVWQLAYDPLYMMKTCIVEAYSRDGALLWTRDIGEKVSGDSYIRDQHCSLPLYANGLLYVPVRNGTAALATNGTICWVKHIAGYDSVIPFDMLPADEAGNVCLAATNNGLRNVQIISIAPDGTVSDNNWSYSYRSPISAVRDDGTVYVLTDNANNFSGNPAYAKLAGLFKFDALTARDIKTGQTRWTFDIPDDDMQFLTLNGSTIDRAIPDLSLNADAKKMNEMPGLYAGNPADTYPRGTNINYLIGVNPSRDIVYVNYYVAVYEDPIIFNRSKCVYVNTLYALDDTGRLIWKKPVSGLVTATAASNSTIFYSTNDGKIGGNPAGIAAGIALAAIAYMFLRFLMVGTVARAKSRLEQNENRNKVLQYIVEHPGVTAADLARDMRINMGTIRYHLFVLTMNHKVATHKESEKFLRYFKNSGAYTQEDREYLSLVRRKPLHKILCALTDKPMLSSSDLAEELDISLTAVNRHVNELVEKGIVEKLPGTERGYAYAIKARHRERIKELLGHF